MLQWLVLHFAVALIGTWLALRYALRRNLLDHPGERRSHQVATARGGGAAIVVALLVAAGVLALRDPGQRPLLGAFALGLTLVAGAGLVDDHRPLSAWIRLLAHGLAALLLALVMFHVTADWRMAAVVLVLAIVLANIWNFIDGINGIAATQALLVAGAIAAMGSASNADGAWVWMAAALAAACAGFLPYNFPRARIFLGDVGSGALGYSVAAIGVMTASRDQNLSWMLLFPLSAVVVDSSLTLLRRMIRGEAWWRAHSQHAYQVWARQAGHTRVTLAYAGWTLAGAAVMLGGRNAPVSFMLYSALAWYTSAGLLWWWLQCMEPETHSQKGKDA